LQLFELPLGPGEWILIVLVGLYFVTRVPWWVGRVCVPSPETVESVRERAPGWATHGLGRIADFPDAVNAFGFFATPLWILILALNLVLLAQSLEVFMPSADRFEIPFFGSYTWLSLLAGLLFSLSQTVFGVIAGENKRRSIVILSLLLVFISIGVEMGLAGYRSYMIITHVVDVDATTADSLLSKGVALTMFISFIVPVAHTALGFVSVPRFLVPLANYFPRFVKGLAMLLWSWFARFYFGFQRISILPAAISQLRTETSALKGRIAKTDAECRIQQKNLRDLSDLGAPFSHLQSEASTLAVEGKALRDAWKQKASELLGSIAAIDSRKQPARDANEQKDRIVEEAATFKSIADRSIRDGILYAKRLIGILEALPKVDQNWRVKHGELKLSIPRLALETQKAGKDLEDLRALRERYALILTTPPGSELPERVGSGDFLEFELKKLLDRLFNATTESERNRINRVLSMCTAQLADIRNDLNAAENSIKLHEHTLVDLATRLKEVTHPSAAPPAQAIDAEKRKLEAAMQDMVSASLELAASVKRFARDARRKRGGGLFGWIGRLFADFIDAIMGANVEKKREAEQTKEAEFSEMIDSDLKPSVNLAVRGENR